MARDLLVDFREADLSERNRAMLEFAEKVARHDVELSQADLADMRQGGFTDPDLLAIIYWVANVNLANTLTDNVGLGLHEGMDAIFVDDDSPPPPVTSSESTRETLRTGWERASIAALEGTELEWFNADPLTWADLEGRPLLFLHLDFAHANSLLTIPLLVELHRQAAYRLAIIALQAGEFSLGKDRSFVRSEIQRLGIDFPVIFDPSYRRMAGANNRFWPSLQLIDGQGYVRFRQYGPGRFAALGRQLQSVVAGLQEPPVSLGTDAAEGAEEQLSLHPQSTPELYTSYRGGNRKGGLQGSLGEVTVFARSEVAEPDHLYVEGEWKVERDGLVLVSEMGRMHFRYHARRAGVLLAPSDPNPSQVRLSLDGTDVKAAARGADLDAGSRITVHQARFHWLVHHAEFESHHLDAQFEGPGLKVFRFNFLPFRGESDVFLGT